ncbi:capsule biosynthesis protein capC, partial [Candidatus Bathyarchaeota archaeon]
MVVYGVTLDTAEVAIALGIGVSMLFYEKQNLVPGGVIVPGYVALTLD